MNAHICLVTTTKPNFLSVVKVYYMQLLLFFMVLLRRIYLKALDYHIVLLGFLNLKDLMDDSSMLELVLKFGFAELTMECFPSVADDIWRNLFILIPGEPLSKTLQMDKLHGSTAFAWRNKWIDFVILIREADSAHEVGGLLIINIRAIIH
jgi:hypothetical protein